MAFSGISCKVGLDKIVDLLFMGIIIQYIFADSKTGESNNIQPMEIWGLFKVLENEQINYLKFQEKIHKEVRNHNDKLRKTHTLPSSQNCRNI